MTITIYHNPACGASRNTLAMIRQSGEVPVVIEYLKHPPSRERLVELLAARRDAEGRAAVPPRTPFSIFCQTPTLAL